MGYVSRDLGTMMGEVPLKTEEVLRLSSNMIGDNETNFTNKLLLTYRQTSNLRKAFTNHLSTAIKLSKTYLSKMM